MKKLGLLILFCLQFSCNSQVEKKINGISFVSSRDKVTQKNIAPILAINANAASVMPFGFIRDVNEPDLIYNSDRQWFGERRDGIKHYVDILHKNKMSIMLKPQIWIRDGKFTGTLEMKTEEHWQKFEKKYSDFILTYAALAEEVNVDIFCIGTELEKFVLHRPDFWNKLITDVKKVYKGKLTYAANWDEYPRVPFWKSIDYVGVDAYFPLSKEQHPTVDQLKAGWQPHKKALKQMSNTLNKPILFTEYGYRSMDFTGEKPWLVDRNQTKVNLEAQSNATKAILEMFWTEDWFAGGYVWKWFIDHDKVGGEDDNRFTPQNKPAELVLKQYYGFK
ncbi:MULTISPECIES: glycoside hydrolase family 113 [unclassified Cellulophaga]|uniref:glycoside hydrolase family 113 n=1 Tax=unclassified Cellulophaga TaxID=2634405 RepID=UPI000C2CA568|nr:MULTISPECIES: glycoside hydrolase TIM-barrel-like domain-containing protein [unclassified Cellulophaga]MDO6491825.1 glycoside hydrolase TIM-barrel-like domain-containing protein [Cellulophaga sp. 2_MG-2023]MDO6495520.1 glycoside hydrolase TIM-barrel-like domain-containing protein [Cellulophaga sp. 3_MG-2023]PKB43172.1 Gene Transfer Agent (GTA)-like protein [Cellulophaga sp. RHA19]